jgi:hypothetical protein
MPCGVFDANRMAADPGTYDNTSNFFISFFTSPSGMVERVFASQAFTARRFF